jgi:hypothetical protein
MIGTRSRRGRSAWTLITAVTALVLGFVMGGCDKQTQAKGRVLAATGATTAADMQRYYEGLARGENEIYEAVLFTDRSLLTSTRPSVSAEVIKLEQRQDQLRLLLADQFMVRARAAKQLSATYTALAMLSSYDASGEASRAAGALATELRGLKVLPETSDANFDPAGLFRVAASSLLSAKQSRDIREGARAIALILNDWKVMVDTEKEVYKGRATTRLKTLTTVVVGFTDAQQLSGSSLSLFQNALELYSLKTSPGDMSFATPGQRLGLQSVIRNRESDIQKAVNGTPDTISSALGKLKREHDRFESGQELQLGDLIVELNKLKEDIDLIFPAKKNGA